MLQMSGLATVIRLRGWAPERIREARGEILSEALKTLYSNNKKTKNKPTVLKAFKIPLCGVLLKGLAEF